MPNTQGHTSVKRRILVVDDNLDHVNSMATLLRQMGHEVWFAISGAAALDVARLFHPDFIFLDLGLPDISGYEVVRQLRQDPETRAVRILAVTGRALDGDHRRSLEAGCDDHLPKPLDLTYVESLFATRH
jgi:CheY-like chemotaxis protein